MKCLICGLGPAPEHGGVTVYRQNAFGETGVWACRAHRTAPVDAEEQRLVDILEAA